jgi:hypothetical protein
MFPLLTPSSFHIGSNMKAYGHIHIWIGLLRGHQALRSATASLSRRTGHFWPGCKKYIYVRPLGMLLRNGNDASICRYNENESPPPFFIFTRSVELTPVNPHHMPSDLNASTIIVHPSPCSTAFDMNIRSPHQTHRRTHALKTAQRFSDACRSVHESRSRQDGRVCCHCRRFGCAGIVLGLSARRK